MTVNTVGASAPTASATSKATAAAGITSAADQQDRFMKLLVAQMRNQDPLNPMDNAQMTGQIAQINTVAGLEKLNKTVEGLASDLRALMARSAATSADANATPSSSSSASANSTTSSKDTQA